MSAESPAVKPHRIAPLVWMVLLFAAPVVAAWVFYLNPVLLPAGRTNHGALIAPVIPLPGDRVVRAASGEPLDWEALDRRWTLVLVAGPTCAEQCLARVDALRRIRLALGEPGLEVQRLLLLAGAPVPAPEAEAIARQFTGMHVATLGTNDLAGLGEDALGRIYLRDPMGHLMMRYAPDAPAQDTLEDMETLLKATKSWIKGAQYGHK